MPESDYLDAASGYQIVLHPAEHDKWRLYRVIGAKRCELIKQGSLQSLGAYIYKCGKHSSRQTEEK